MKNYILRNASGDILGYGALTLAEAAEIVLTYDGQEYEIRSEVIAIDRDNDICEHSIWLRKPNAGKRHWTKSTLRSFDGTESMFHDLIHCNGWDGTHAVSVEEYRQEADEFRRDGDDETADAMLARASLSKP